jgi:RimJ/RimL family protein N-acetyltransferase
MDITIRKAMINETYEFASCKIEAWQSAYKGIIPDEYLNSMSVEQHAERYKEWMKDQNTEYYFVICNNETAGILVLSKCDNEDKPNAGDIIAIYLLKPYWNKGHGRTMMNFAMDRLKQLGYDEVVIWSLEDNIRAKQFYEKFGFVFDGSKVEMNFGELLTAVRHVVSFI